MLPQNSVAKVLEDQILSGLLVEGASVPSERDLASDLGVSRSTVREAFRLLEERGLLETKSGRGAQVARVRTSKPAESIALWAFRSDVSPRHLIQARVSIELEAVRLAAESSKNRDPSLGLQLLREMQRSPESPTAPSLDIAFHLYLARLSGNPLYELFLTTLAPLTSQLIRENSKEQIIQKRRHVEHQRILSAVAAGDADQAMKFMRSHLEAGYDFIQNVDSPRLSLNLDSIEDFDSRVHGLSHLFENTKEIN